MPISNEYLKRIIYKYPCLETPKPQTPIDEIVKITLAQKNENTISPIEIEGVEDFEIPNVNYEIKTEALEIQVLKDEEYDELDFEHELLGVNYKIWIYNLDSNNNMKLKKDDSPNSLLFPFDTEEFPDGVQFHIGDKCIFISQSFLNTQHHRNV